MHSRRRRIICSSSEGRVSTTLSSVAEQYGQRMEGTPGVSITSVSELRAGFVLVWATKADASRHQLWRGGA
jgi:hypothetical protein